MGKRRGQQKPRLLNSGHQSNLTLRQENSGRKQIKGSSNNANSMLKLKHLQKVAAWASGEASIPSLGAFLGQHLASYGEAIGVPLDPSLFPCQRCESILQPGFNCTVRIQKSKAKTRRRSKKPNNSTQNNVVYKCHFCLHCNLKKGTPIGHLKEIYLYNAKPTLKSTLNSVKLSEVKAGAHHMDEKASPEKARITGAGQSVKSMVVDDSEKLLEIKADATHGDETSSPEKVSEIALNNSPATPLVRTGLTLLDRYKRKRNKSTSIKPPENDKSSAKTDTEKGLSTSSKRRRKSWTSLKEIAEKSGGHHENNMPITNLSIPFFL